MRTAGSILVLQHPHERKKPLATVPLLPHVLKHVHVHTARHLKDPVVTFPQLRPALDPVVPMPSDTRTGHHSPSIAILFPSRESIPLHTWMTRVKGGGSEVDPTGRDSIHNADTEAFDSNAPETCHQEHLDGSQYILLVIDGTWMQASEMFRRLPASLLERATVVHLPLDLREPHAVLGLRSEPREDCMTTAESVALALGELEGMAVREAIMRSVERMTRLQAQWDPSVQARLEKGVEPTNRRRNLGNIR
jgi:DTW domain-containing protein YfiP